MTGGQRRRLSTNQRAVSPVIATILMVAITVVLAAVLYVMVGQFAGGGPEGLDIVGIFVIEVQDNDTAMLEFQRLPFHS